MPFDSNGTFNRIRNWVSDATAGIKIRADYHDSEDDNFAAGLSNVITKDGRTQPTAHLPMNGKKLVNLGPPEAPTDAVTKAYVDSVRNFPQGTDITGADANGRLNFTATTGKNGITWTGADLSWLARKAGDPVNMPNRLVLNDKVDGSGTDVFGINEGGSIFAPTLQINSNAFHDGTAWRVIGAGFPNLLHANPSNGTWAWYSAAATTAAGQVVTINIPMTLTKDGALGTLGTITAGDRVTATNYVQSNNGRLIAACTTAAVTQPSVTLYSVARGSAFTMFNQTNNTLCWGSADGSGNPTNSLMAMDTSGNLALQNGSLTVSPGGITSYNSIRCTGSHIYAYGNLYMRDGLGAFADGGSGRILQFAPGWYFDFNTGSGQLTWRMNNGQWMQFFVDGAYWISGSTGAKSVSGSWASWSDARIKTVLGDYKMGLQQVLQIRPRRFQFKEGDDRNEHVGIVAQEIEGVLPDTVKRMSGEIGGHTVEDKRLFDMTNITYALVNAVKELKAELDKANARIAALEAQ